MTDTFETQADTPACLGKRQNRRQFFKTMGLGLSAGIGLTALPKPVLGMTPTPGKKPFIPPRDQRLVIHNIHTDEMLDIVFWSRGHYLPGAMKQIDYFLRDFRTGGIKRIDPKLLSAVSKLYDVIGTDRPLEIVSGYRSPETNARLRRSSSGVSKNSYHMKGMAIDINMPGYRTSYLRNIAKSLKVGGVGYYPKSYFIHMDTGPIRYW
jgi:uncharacterized protein YcbK (DUF882 family)